jgi:hypothetical protein
VTTTVSDKLIVKGMGALAYDAIGIIHKVKNNAQEYPKMVKFIFFSLSPKINNFYRYKRNDY